MSFQVEKILFGKVQIFREVESFPGTVGVKNLPRQKADLEVRIPMHKDPNTSRARGRVHDVLVIDGKADIRQFKREIADVAGRLLAKCEAPVFPCKLDAVSRAKWIAASTYYKQAERAHAIKKVASPHPDLTDYVRMTDCADLDAD